MRATTASESASGEPRIGPLVGRCVLRFALGMPVLAALVLLPAGTLRWPAGRLLLFTFAACVALNMAVLLACNPVVVAARTKRHRDAHSRDRWVAAIASLAALGTFLVAGLDFRWAWTGPWPAWCQAAGLALLLLGDLVFLWAAAINRFFTKEVAIQTERGHHVVDGGPYRFVRHPGYVGFSLMCVGIPLILGSKWAIIPGVLSVAGIVVRTFFEDIMLRNDLPGYREYATQVRFRLVPGLW